MVRFKKIYYFGFLIIFCCNLFLTSCNVNKESATDKAFEKFTNNLFINEVTSNTINLHYTLQNPSSYGIDDYDITYGHLDETSINNSSTKIMEVVDALNSFDYNDLSYENQITHDILTYYYTTESTSGDFPYYTEVLSATTGMQAQLPVLLAEYSFNNEQDILDYLSLLAITDTYFEEVIDFETTKSELGLFMPDFAANDVIAQCEDFIANEDNNFLVETFNNRIDEMDDISENSKNNYKLENKYIIKSDLIPAYKILINGLTKLEGNSKNPYGLCYFENGQEYFEYLVKSYTGSNKSVSDITDMILDQMEEDLNKMSSIANENSAVLASTEDYSFSLSDPNQILEDLKTKITEDFPDIPNTSYCVKYIDDSLASHLSPAFYLTPTIDNVSDNNIYINPESSYTKLDLYTTLAHEGYPGHLYQNIYFNNVDADNIRRILSFGGYTEGWATYVEMYSYGISGVDEDLASILQLNNSVTLGMYAYIDIGINYNGWTLNDTYDFLSSMGFDSVSVANSIYKIIVEEPANYLKYYVGYLEFLELKNIAQSILGNHFILKDFHKYILEMGPAPFSVLEKHLYIWAEQYQ